MRSREILFIDEGDYCTSGWIDGGYIPVYPDDYVKVDLTKTKQVFEKGRDKHKDQGFDRGKIPISKHFYAALRHLWKWFFKHQVDEETGISHLHHAHCRILMMIYQEQRSINDDR